MPNPKVNFAQEITNKLMPVLKELPGDVLVERETGQRIHLRIVEGGIARHLYIRVQERQSQ